MRILLRSKTHQANLQNLLNSSRDDSLVSRLAKMDPESKGYMKLYDEVKRRQEELNIITDHLNRHDQGDEYQLDRSEEQGRREYGNRDRLKAMVAGLKSSDKAAKTSSSKKASKSKPKAGRTKSAKAPSPAKASNTKGERASLDELHARARELRAKEGLPDEVKPEDVRHNDKGKLLLQPSPDYKPDQDEKINPFATPDAYIWAKQWGDRQLGAVLSDGFLHETLVKMAAKAGIEHAEGIRSKAELISRITAKVTNGRYSADFGKATSEGRHPSSGKSPRGQDESKSSRPTNAELKSAPKAMPQFKVPGFKPDPMAPINPVFYHRIYGSDRLEAAFRELSTYKLRESADRWMRDHPDDGKPSSRSSKDALVNFLLGVAHKHDGTISSQSDVDTLQQSNPVK